MLGLPLTLQFPPQVTNVRIAAFSSRLTARRAV
jgi:hypothetical protein